MQISSTYYEFGCYKYRPQSVEQGYGSKLFEHLWC